MWSGHSFGCVGEEIVVTAGDHTFIVSESAAETAGCRNHTDWKTYNTSSRWEVSMNMYNCEFEIDADVYVVRSSLGGMDMRE